MVTKRKPSRASVPNKVAPATDANVDSDPISLQLADVLARLQKLESAQRDQPRSSSPAPDPERYWLLEELARIHQAANIKGGSVAYGGDVVTPTGQHYLWQQQRLARELFKQDWQSVDRVLAALGHPVRLRLLHAILHGKTTKNDLEHLDGLGTTGQLYHHLKILEEAGWVRSLERGVYGVPGERVVPLLTMLSAAAG